MHGWARAEMEQAAVWDRRCVRSLTRICERLAQYTGVSFSTACGAAGRQAAHRIFTHESTTIAGLLQGHVQQTASRGQQQCGPQCATGPLLVAQDTTFLNYQTHGATTGLGPIHHAGSEARGLVSHAALALTPQGLPLGLLHLDIWARDPAAQGQKATRHLRDTADKESQKGLDGLHAIEAATPAEQALIVLADREADVFDYLAAPRRATTHLIVRAQHPRRVRCHPSTTTPPLAEGQLLDLAASAPLLGHLTVEVPRKRGQAARTAVLELRCVPLWILPPGERRLRNKGKEPVAVWVVCAQEPAGTELPQGAERIVWYLLCTQPVTDRRLAERMVQYYCCRWRIERLHFTLKSGLQVERLQCDDATTLQHALALCYVVAWRLLWLTYLAREEPDAPATTLCTATELAVLAAATQRPSFTRREVIRTIAKLGGFPGNPSAGEPGVKTLWLGLRQLEQMVLGWSLALQTFTAMRQD